MMLVLAEVEKNIKNVVCIKLKKDSGKEEYENVENFFALYRSPK